MLLFALVRAVEVIGEAANKVSAAGRADLPDIRYSASLSSLEGRQGHRSKRVGAGFDSRGAHQLLRDEGQLTGAAGRWPYWGRDSVSLAREGDPHLSQLPSRET